MSKQKKKMQQPITIFFEKNIKLLQEGKRKRSTKQHLQRKLKKS